MSAQPNQKPMPEPDWHRYEQLKREWISTHPYASDREWNKAMRAIAQKAGV